MVLSNLHASKEPVIQKEVKSETLVKRFTKRNKLKKKKSQIFLPKVHWRVQKVCHLKKKLESKY